MEGTIFLPGACPLAYAYILTPGIKPPTYMLLNEFINCKKTLTRSVKKYVSGRLVCHAFFLATFPKQFKNKHFLSLSVTFIFIIVFPVIFSVTFRDYTTLYMFFHGKPPQKVGNYATLNMQEQTVR